MAGWLITVARPPPFALPTPAFGRAIGIKKTVIDTADIKPGDGAENAAGNPAPPSADSDKVALQWASRPASAPLFVNVSDGASGRVDPKKLYADRAGRVFEADGTRHRGNWNIWDDPFIGRAKGGSFEKALKENGALATPAWAINRIKAAITTPKGGGGTGTNSPAARFLPTASGGGGIGGIRGIFPTRTGGGGMSILAMAAIAAVAFFAWKKLR